ncbi:IclR family transcriptional regulator [Desulfuromonas versatilis]|uniref:IclR family transcriptional regulator n=1 Tax=Desulfuromonas versatilis TaxID=2802975 RepID=A0ABN6DUX1_9BACT|nr:IclR family transcriptional regulator [Desulfuromonas versatilis]BCR03674.1 IclR family transcriptional regulator [Desulfuromonas versatilis]
MAKKEKSDYIIHAVSNALELLEQFHSAEEAMSVSDLALKLKMQKNTVIRLLTNLEVRGYVEHDKAFDRYRLGLKALELGQNYLHQGGLLRRAGPALENIVQSCHETAYLALLEKRHILYVAAVESDQTVRVVSRLGTRLPAYCTASGKVHMAHLPAATLDKLYPEEDLEGFTPTTLTSKESLRRELQEIAPRDYAIDNEEYEKEIRCVAVPVRDYTQSVVGALSVSGPSFRMTQVRIEEEIAPLLLSVATELSATLGYIR